MLWVEMQNQSGILAAKWQRSAALSDDGIVFAPAAIAGDEQKVFYAAMWEAIPVVTEYGHSYVPTNWMVREYPDTLEVCTLIESKVRGAATNAEPEACESPRPSTHGPLRKAEQDTDHTPGQQSPRMSPHESPPKTIQVDPRLAEEVPFSGKLTEGALCRVTVNAYERNPIARANCIATLRTYLCGVRVQLRWRVWPACRGLHPRPPCQAAVGDRGAVRGRSCGRFEAGVP